MIAMTHQNFGLTFGLLTVLFLQLFGIYPIGILQTIIFFLLVLFGSLLPDLDTPYSKLGRRLWPVSFIISRFVKHRTATHSLLFVAGVTIIGIIISSILKISWIYAFGLSLGTLSHIIGDWLTVMGVPFLYPFKKKKFRARITFKTGSATEYGICIGLVFLNILLLKIIWERFISTA